LEFACLRYTPKGHGSACKIFEEKKDSDPWGCLEVAPETSEYGQWEAKGKVRGKQTLGPNASVVTESQWRFVSKRYPALLLHSTHHSESSPHDALSCSKLIVSKSIAEK
jgi:hypothetical protein